MLAVRTSWTKNLCSLDDQGDRWRKIMSYPRCTALTAACHRDQRRLPYEPSLDQDANSGIRHDHLDDRRHRARRTGRDRNLCWGLA